MTLPPGIAARPSESRGRVHAEPDQGPRGPRDAFQRDRDRIVHSVAFRRLRHKTQVFVAPDGDHYRVRLTHSVEVAQIGRTIARVLGLNEDLTEALCLAHDLGHPPFGHAGEDALDAAIAPHGGFDHNGHTLRLVTRLETTYPDFDGLNLNWETLEGLAKHNGPVTAPQWALAGVDAEVGLELQTFASLEAQVAALADDIAYDNHDIDDGLRAGVLPLDALLELPFVARHWDAIGRRWPDLPMERRVKALVRDQIGTMVGDLLAETRRRVAGNGAETIADVRAAGMALAGFSAELVAEERALKRCLYANLYNAPALQPVRVEAQRVVANLAAAYLDDPRLLPDAWHRGDCPETTARNVADYIAGMTDPFAIKRHEELVGPVELPEKF
ncbi:deoxyguanosinetriphosphate triphosphohydrolase [Sphingomonas astaxanthinifaciens]|uniref:Deoxyguanosinetriphosphate triphosphohydrolase-like protein n=1 Tax=Sphingomonas astaxanthinifaciens DSM 22298 TaxID=1123267 RepID=A0ABQ5Z727_9SPHN|nr:deoxyguanosinetriphosphate triphosphohydrolase [Sphingomonas astaxanthinifaciens]GLR47221.1 deoxyguanosinetriphosphate triphosphohydrolase-like protein [Sphingomonas astaxanthinifaciens DSM 22298]